MNKGKLFWRGVILMLICMVCGCGGQQKQEEAPFFWIDDFMGVTYSQQGAFYSENSLVHFLDVTNETDSVVCDDIMCNHRGGKGSTCSAYIPGQGVLSTVLEEDHLLLVTGYGGNRIGELSLYQTDLDGSNRNCIASLGDMQLILDMQITDEIIVIAYQNSYDKNMMPLDKEQTGIYVYDREKNKGEVVWGQECFGAMVCNAFFADNTIYFWYFHYGNGESWEEKRIDALCRLDLETREVIVIEEGLGAIQDLFVWNDKILYGYQNEVWQYDTITGEKSRAIEQELTVLPCYFTDWVLLQSGNVYYAYNGDELRKIAEYEGLGIMVAYPNVIYGNNYNTETGNGEKVYWSFEDFLEGDIDAMRPFEK